MAKVYGDEPGRFDEFKKLKDEPLKVKLDYLWTYYGKLAIAVVIIIAIGISVATSMIRNSKPRVIHGISCACQFEEGTEEILRTYLIDKLNLDEKKYLIDYTPSVYSPDDTSTSYAYFTKIAARISAKDLDFIVSNLYTFDSFMSKDDPDMNVFVDLSTVLPEDLYNALLAEDRILFYEAEYGTIPYVVKVDNSKAVSLLGLYLNDQYLGVVVNAQNIDATVALFRSVLE